jgi:hypothetical protein
MALLDCFHLAGAALILAAFKADDVWSLIQKVGQAVAAWTDHGSGDTKSESHFTLFERDHDGSMKICDFASKLKKHQD